MTSRGQIRGAETSLAAVKSRYGGIDVPASLAGMLTAVGMLVVLAALAAGFSAALGYRLAPLDIAAGRTDVVMTGLAVALVVLFVSFGIGGWAAGRIARYDGGANGLAAALWSLLLAAALLGLAAWAGSDAELLADTGVADWLRVSVPAEAPTAVAAAGAAALLVMAAGGYLGGKLGEMYHRKADAALADSQLAITLTTPLEETSLMEERTS